MKSRRTRALRMMFNALAVGMSFAFFAAFAYHVYRFDFKPMAALGVPILVVFFGFASLFFIRGRSLAKGSAQFRSLVAAERAVQAALWHLSGIMLGTVFYALLMRSGVALDASERWLVALWMLLFLAPHALMQIGLFTFMRAVLVVAPQLFRRVGAFELRRRVALT
jgi:signal transduction histidine kinase